MATGFLGMLHQSATSGQPVDASWRPIVDGLSRHGLMAAISAMTILAYSPARTKADRGGLPLSAGLRRYAASTADLKISGQG